MRKCMHEKKPAPRRKRVKSNKPEAHERAYKAPERLIKLVPDRATNLRTIERAGAPPTDRFIKPARANVHVHPRHKRNVA